MKIPCTFLLWSALGAPFLTSQTATAIDTLIDPGYTGTALFSDLGFSSWDISGDQFLAYTFSDGLLGVDLASGEARDSYGTIPAAYAEQSQPFNSFLRHSSDGQSAWIGWTTSTLSDDRIYAVDISGGEGSGSWSLAATLPGNYDLVEYQGDVLVSGLNESSFGNNKVLLLDAFGQNNHDLLITIGGNSTGLAFAPDGDLWIGQNHVFTGISDPERLLRFPSASLANGNLTSAQADASSFLTGPASHLTVDEDGIVYFTTNTFGDGVEIPTENRLFAFDPSIDNEPRLIASRAEVGFKAFSRIATANGAIYLETGDPGLLRISPIPEPRQAVLLSGAILLLTVTAARHTRSRA